MASSNFNQLNYKGYYKLQFFIEMSILPSDMIYRDLKQKGLQLSKPTIVRIPEQIQNNSSFIKKISSFLSKSQRNIGDSSTQVYQILSSNFMVWKRNLVFIYKYTFKQQEKVFQVTESSSFGFNYIIEKIYPCDDKYIQDREFPILFKGSKGLAYFNFDIKDNNLAEKNFLKFPNVRAVGWLSDRECLVVTHQKIHHFIISFGNMRQKSSIMSSFIINDSEIIKQVWIFSNIDEQQDSIISIFYCTMEKNPVQGRQNKMKLKIKQYIRTLDGEIIQSPNPDYCIESQSLQYNKDSFKIVSVGQYYCLQLPHEILIIKKKFDKYMLLDNMKQLLNNYTVKLNRKGLVASIGEKLVQLNSIQFADPKCVSRILDVIQYPQELTTYNKNFKQIWAININKQYNLIFVFLKQNELALSSLIKLEPMEKMLTLAKKAKKEQLQIVQQMALNLGIERKDFYLKLWSTSQKQNHDIYQYLLECKDVNSIKKELHLTLKTRTIQVSEMLKILERITKLNLQNLATDINQKNLKEFVKNDFLRKKIKLNQVNKMLDHRIFNNIYSSSLLNIFVDIVSEKLDPIQPKFDPLHLDLNYQPIKQLKSLENVLQQFKVVLLEEYKTFLLDFLSKFPNKILEVLTYFPFLLPNHPFQIQVQKPSKTNEPVLPDPKKNDTEQQLWFQTVTVAEWQEQITKQKLQKILLNCYPTSKVTQTLDQFYNSNYGIENKRWKHGLITANLQDYTKKIKSLSGVELYLDVCQFANQLSVLNNGDEKISQKILKILEQKNKLTQEKMKQCKLFANMHFFMLKNKIIPKNKLDISYLKTLKPENLIAIFFLQNKQRKEHVFTDFKDLYEDKNEFNEVLRKFVESENCSRIELEILMKDIKSKGFKFQQDNQDIIDILITGVCMKVELREPLLILDIDEDDEDPDPAEIDEIQLSKPLALKINRIKRLKCCKEILRFFGFEKHTYQNILDLQKENKIFILILKKYFQLKEDEERVDELEVNIQDEQRMNLENPRSLLTVLIYLQQNVFYSAKSFDILILFGMELILWKEFDLVTQLINDDIVLETLQIKRSDYVEALTVKALELIYLDEQILFDEQTNEQILSIINIDQEDTPLKIRESGKLILVIIFAEWGLEVHPKDIHKICCSWKEENKQQFMSDLINKYIDKLNFETFQKIYHTLEIIDKETEEINIFNSEFVIFCNLYSRKLLQKKRHQEASQVIAFLMDIKQMSVDYKMLAQAYIESVAEIFGDDEEKGKLLVQLFVQKYDTSQQQSIKNLLSEYFSTTDIILRAFQIDRLPTILINWHYYFDQKQQRNCTVSYNDLWTLAKKQSSCNKQLLYNYFFLSMGLNNPKKGFAEICGIPYNLDKITNMLIGSLDQYFSKNENLWFVNYGILQAKFLYEGLFGQAAHLLNFVIDSDRKNKFDMIIKELRNKKSESERNEKLLNNLLKLKPQVLNKYKAKARNENYLKKKQEEKREKVQLEEIEQQIQVVEEIRPEVFINWKKVQEDKKYYSSISHTLICEKELIDKVFENQLELSRVRTNSKQTSITQRKNILQGLFLTSKASEPKGDLEQLIIQKKYEQVGKYTKEEVITTIKNIFYQEGSKRSFMEIIEVLDSINIGNEQKRDIFRLVKIYLECLSNQLCRILFPIQFFLKPIQVDQSSEISKPSLIFQQFKPKVKELINKITIYDLKEIGNLMSSILGSTKYEGKIYLEVLLQLGRSHRFESSSALLAHECIVGIHRASPELIQTQFKSMIDGMITDKEMKLYVKQILLKIVGEKQYDRDFVQQIRRYE